jgi:hypothetical protein
VKRILITGILLLAQLIKLLGQEPVKPWQVELEGFINAQLFFDTRQNVIAREGMFALYPQNAAYDEYGNDMNARANLNQAAMTTRLRLNISAPDVWGAKATGVVEVDFTGVNELDLNGLRLREAWIKLTWKQTALLIGQYWHPMCVPEAMPKTISLNLGAPYHPFSRHNQVRLQHALGRFNIIAVAACQMDYASDGPLGRSPVYMINAALPNLDLQLQYKTGKGDLFGVGMDYKKLLPRLRVELVPGQISKANEHIHSVAATAFMKLSTKLLELKWQALWGQNMTEHIMLGGYIEDGVDSLNNKISYANTHQVSSWIDIITSGKTIRVGMFAGIAKNLGYTHEIAGNHYARGNDIAYSYRLSPRLQLHFNKLMLAGEFEFTTAAYGQPDAYGNFQKAESLANFRLLLAVFYFF